MRGPTVSTSYCSEKAAAINKVVKDYYEFNNYEPTNKKKKLKR